MGIIKAALKSRFAVGLLEATENVLAENAGVAGQRVR